MSTRREGYDFRKWHAAEMQSRPRRAWMRWALLTSVATTLALAAFFTVRPPDHMPGLIWFPLVTMWGSPFARDSWATERGLASYDEFERTALLRATARAYAAFLLLVGVLLVWLWAATAMDWPRPETTTSWYGWGMALLGVGLALPVTFAEWTVPMPTEDDDA